MVSYNNHVRLEQKGYGEGMNVANTIALLGGLAFFLFGMTLLGEGLKRVAGSKMEVILEKLTSTTFKGVLLGSLVTAVIQSSSATTVMMWRTMTTRLRCSVMAHQ